MKQHATLWPIVLTAFLDLLGLGIVIPVFAPLFLETGGALLHPDTPLHVRTSLMGLLIAAYPLAQFFGAPVLGGLSDRFGRKRILVLSLLGTTIGYLIFVIGLRYHDLPLLFLGRAIDGFTGGNISIALSAVADIRSGHRKTKAYGLMGVAIGLGLVLGPFVGGKLADPHLVSWFNLTTPFWFVTALSALNALLVTLFFKETLVHRVSAQVSWMMGIDNLFRAFRTANLRNIFLVIFLLNFGFNFFAQFFQVYLFQKFMLTESQTGDLFAYAGIWLVLSQGILTRPLAHKLAHHQIVALSSLGLAVGLLLLLLPEKPVGLYAVLPIVALFQGLVQPNSLSLISDLGHHGSQGEIMGMNQSVQSLAQAIPPIIAGVLVSLHPNLPIIGASLAVFVAWLIFTIFFMPSFARSGRPLHDGASSV